MPTRVTGALAGLLAALAGLAAGTPAAAAAEPGTSHGGRYRFCMLESSGCSHRFVGGDLPSARFEDRSGARPRVQVCVRDRRGRRCWPAQRPRRPRAAVARHILYRTTGAHVTTWLVSGKVVGRWRWRVVPESE
jgi:hypothetical protein